MSQYYRFPRSSQYDPSHPYARRIGTRLRDEYGRPIPGEYNNATGSPLTPTAPRASDTSVGASGGMTPKERWQARFADSAGTVAAAGLKSAAPGNEPAAPPAAKPPEPKPTPSSTPAPPNPVQSFLRRAKDKFMSYFTGAGPATPPPALPQAPASVHPAQWNERGERLGRVPRQAPRNTALPRSWGLEYDPQHDRSIQALDPEKDNIPPGAERGYKVGPQYGGGAATVRWRRG